MYYSSGQPLECCCAACHTARCIVLLTLSSRYTVNAMIHKGWLLSNCPAANDYRATHHILLVALYCLLYIVTIHSKRNDQHEHVCHEACAQWMLQSSQFVIHGCG